MHGGLFQRDAFKTIESIGIFPHQKQKCRRLGVWFCSTLLPFFERSLIDMEPARKYRPRTSQLLSCFPYQTRVHLRQLLSFHLVRAKSEFALAMLLHRLHAFHELIKNVALAH